MGKNLTKCFIEMKRKASQGKEKCIFALREDDIAELTDEGFEVVLPHNYRVDKENRKLLWEVTISWQNPMGAKARRLKKMVKLYRRKYNLIEATETKKAGKKASTARKAVAEWTGLDFIPVYPSSEPEPDYAISLYDEENDVEWIYPWDEDPSTWINV